MPIISKEEEIQEELNVVYTLLLDKKEIVRTELQRIRKNFDDACDNYINSGFPSENTWEDVNNSHHTKFIEYEIYCQLVEIINDFKDLHGQFPDYIEMGHTLEQIMLKLAKHEKYELAAIMKLWVDKINNIIFTK